MSPCHAFVNIIALLACTFLFLYDYVPAPWTCHILALRQFGHETSQHIGIKFGSFVPSFFFGTGIQTPQFALAYT